MLVKSIIKGSIANFVIYPLTSSAPKIISVL